MVVTAAAQGVTAGCLRALATWSWALLGKCLPHCLPQQPGPPRSPDSGAQWLSRIGGLEEGSRIGPFSLPILVQSPPPRQLCEDSGWPCCLGERARSPRGAHSPQRSPGPQSSGGRRGTLPWPQNRGWKIRSCHLCLLAENVEDRLCGPPGPPGPQRTVVLPFPLAASLPGPGSR